MSFGKLGNKLEVEIFLGAIRSHLFLIFFFGNPVIQLLQLPNECKRVSLEKKSNFNSRVTLKDWIGLLERQNLLD